jgi:hypothetical protein
LGSRIVAIGRCGSDRSNLVVCVNLIRSRGIDAQLGLRLPHRTFCTLESEVQLDRVQTNQRLAGCNFLADFNQHIDDFPGNLAANASLIWRNQSSRQVNRTFD